MMYYITCELNSYSDSIIRYADMAELADAHGSGPCECKFMQVQVLLSAAYLYVGLDASLMKRKSLDFKAFFMYIL